MINMDELRRIFIEKLEKENDFDAAFVKCMWVAYKAGYKDGADNLNIDKEACM